MKKIKPFLLAILAAVSFSSCTLDSASFGVSAVSYPSYRVTRPVVHQPAIYHTPHTYRYYSPPPDYIRYGRHCAPVTRRHHAHH